MIEKSKEVSDRFVEQVRDKFKQRSEVGIKKYNTTLEREDIDFEGWLNHLQEELMDATLYVERLKESYRKLKLYEQKESPQEGKAGLGK